MIQDINGQSTRVPTHRSDPPKRTGRAQTYLVDRPRISVKENFEAVLEDCPCCSLVETFWMAFDKRTQQRDREVRSKARGHGRCSVRRPQKIDICQEPIIETA
jgi:hypothetical protein